jgi:hypothetical protein
MRWLELIHLRPVEASANTALAQLAPLFPNLAGTPNLVAAQVYTQTAISQDVAVHLVWDDSREAGKTPLGLSLAEGLRGLGLVDHSTWKETTP